MAKSTETGSTKSSSISSKAASLKKSVQKKVARPFKKFKQTFSIRSTSCSSTAPAPSENEDDGVDERSDSASGNGGNAGSNVEVTPEEELGKSIVIIYSPIRTHRSQRCSKGLGDRPFTLSSNPR